MNYRTHQKSTAPFRLPFNRIYVLAAVASLLVLIIGVRLFYLQVIRYQYYAEKADKEHFGKSELPARRGEIFIKDYASNNLVRVATNTSLDMLYADPTLIKNPRLVADSIAPLIFKIDDAKKADEARVKLEHTNAKTPEDKEKIKALTDEELFKKFSDDLFDKMSKLTRSQILLSNELTPEALAAIKNLNLTGIEVDENELIAYPGQIADRTAVANTLSTYLDFPPTELETVLKGLNRYVILQRKLQPEISTKIKDMIAKDKAYDKVKNPKGECLVLCGLGFQEEYYRYYPEETLAANILGFVTPQGIGQYGIESKFNTQLQGKKGVFQAQKDSIGRQITVGDTIIQPAVDGDDVVLTIDRSIQLAVERMLARAVKNYQGDNGQAIVMDPKTGRIIAMANYPTFDPNTFGDAFAKEPISLNEDEIKALIPIETEPGSFWLYRNVATEDRIKIFKETNPDGSALYKRYINIVGAEAYQNKAVSEAYEPGSVFKIITMASAIDDKDVTPSTTFNDPGVLYADKNKNGRYEGPDGVRYDARINNVATQACAGLVNMSWIIQNSCNTGISWVAKKMGRNLFYSYMLKFGFNQRTEIEFENESSGNIPHFDEPQPWTDGELANHSYGQGLTVTPIQMINAYAAIANKGILMQPHIVESIKQKDGKIVNVEPTPIQRVISEQTAATIAAMLVNNVENGQSYGRIRVDGHFLGAKTGTAQTNKNGKYLFGVGTTINTVIGFAPMNDPKFVILAKINRPRSDVWADATAGPLLHDIAAFLFNYYSLPPDKK